jgi:BirA family biotin operon repressor/biotin-[acetyl-CoA-carboxylase] ligase
LKVTGNVDRKGLAAVEQLIADEICDDAVYFESTASTNSLALAQFASAEHTNADARGQSVLFLADSQTAGRGRHGRTWQSDDTTLTFSLIWSPPIDSINVLKKISLAVGVGIARCIEFEFAPLKTKLKWPNDVYVDGGKVAGILLETSPSAIPEVVIGVGLNVGSRPDLGDDPNSQSVRSLQDTLQRTIHRYDLLAPVVTGIVETLTEIVANPNVVVDEFRQRCYLTGQTIRFQKGTASSQGKCVGINDEGELIVETEAGQTTLQSGEANLVRAM